MKARQLVLLIILATMTSSVYACGEALYRVGSGMSYRSYSVPLPGNVLIYGDSQGAEELAKALKASGHEVSVVTDPTQLDSALDDGQFEVVIGSLNDEELVLNSVGVPDQAQAEFLPVATNKEEARQAASRYNKVLAADSDELKHYLKAIHVVLKGKA